MLADMDNTGSYDSGQSAFSDDSLEHLSAEEKACLMFLEETIESLDTEDDSGLANDEVDLLPDPGCLASRLAHLSASMSKTKLNGLQKHNALETIREKVENKAIQNYLVPTPFVLASGSNCCEPSVKAGIQLNKKSLSLSQKPAGVHEVNVMKPPASKAKVHFVKTGERGPLSYDALVYLRRSASTKKTPLCPTVDHTIGPSVIKEDPNTGNVGRLDRAISKVSRFMAGPPPVVPKLPKMSSNISVKREKEATPASNSSYSLKNATDPKVVRREALQKLGLLKDQHSETTQVAQLELPKSYLSAGNGFSKRLTNVNPLRSPSFCQAPAPGPGPRNKGLQSSASFHHYSRATSLSHPNQLNRLKVASPEQPTVLVKHKNDKNHSELKSVVEDPPVAPKASDCVTYTVMMVPGMDADRKEALRKLGLLKDK